MLAASMDQEHLSVPNSARGSARGRSHDDRRVPTPRGRRMDKYEYKELLEIKVAEARKKCQWQVDRQLQDFFKYKELTH